MLHSLRHSLATVSTRQGWLIYGWGSLRVLRQESTNTTEECAAAEDAQIETELSIAQFAELR